MNTADIYYVKKKRISLEEALRLAFDAGAAHMMGSHKDFRQTHCNRNEVVSALVTSVHNGINSDNR